MTFLHPDSYPITPLDYRIYDSRGVRKVAAMMPYPHLLDDNHENKQACLNDPFFTDDLNERHHSFPLIESNSRDTCNMCPVQLRCAEWGIAHEEFYMFGGLSAKERVKIRNDRKQQLVPPHLADRYGFGDPWLDHDNTVHRATATSTPEVYASDLEIGEYPDGTH